MNTTRTHAAFALAVATCTTALVLLPASGIAQAAPGYLTTPRTCAGCVGLGGPDTSVGIGNPNDLPQINGFNPQPEPPRVATANSGH